VQRASCALREQGIFLGIPVEMARTLSHNIIEHAFEPEEDFEKLLLLAESAIRYTPRVGIDRELINAHRKGTLATLSPENTGIILNITGTERLYGKDSPEKSAEILASRLKQHLKKLKITAHIGIGPTIGAAWALSRFQDMEPCPERIPMQICSYSELQEISAVLPIHALRLSPDNCLGLRELGIHTIKHLRQLSRKDLGIRFGISLLRAIDEFFGAVPEPIISIHESESIIAEREFDPPIVKHSDITQGIILVFEELLSSAKKKGLSGARFELTLIGSDINYSPFTIRRILSLHTATSQTKEIREILTPIIERVHFQGAISLIRLHIQDAALATAHQKEITSSVPIPKKHSEQLLNKLVSISKRSCLQMIESHKTHLPEKRFSYRPIRPYELPAPSQKQEAALDIIRDFYAFYPTHIFSNPEEILILSTYPNRLPSAMRWRHVLYRAQFILGPEKISPEWWQESLETSALIEEDRDYFTFISNAGEWFWIYHLHCSQKWYLQGIWR